VELSFWDGQTHQEVAQLLGLPPGTVKSRLRLAQGKLAQWLAPIAVGTLRTPSKATIGDVLSGSPFVGFIPVRDPTVARAFYERTLGLTVVADTPFALVVDANGTEIRITPVPELVPQPFTIAGWAVADISSIVRALADLGVRFRRYDGLEQDGLGIWTSPSGDRVAWFSDPDENTLSVTEFVSQ